MRSHVLEKWSRCTCSSRPPAPASHWGCTASCAAGLPVRRTCLPGTRPALLGCPWRKRGCGRASSASGPAPLETMEKAPVRARAGRPRAVRPAQAREARSCAAPAVRAACTDRAMAASPTAGSTAPAARAAGAERLERAHAPQTADRAPAASIGTATGNEGVTAGLGQTMGASA